MKDKFYRITKSPFVKNVTIMATGVAGAQAVTMALSPLITRLYGPEAFGIMGTFTALTRVIIPIAALTFPIAIVLPKDDKEAKGLIKLSVYISFVTAGLIAVLLALFKSSIISMFNLEEISPFIYFLPLIIIFAGLLQVSEQWLIRTNQFAINAKVNFLQSVIINGSKVGIGLIYPYAVVLVLLQVMSNALKSVMMIIFVRKSKYRSDDSNTNEKISLRQLAKKYYDFPLYRAPEEFLSALSQSLPVLLLTSLFGPASAGFYNIGRTVLSLPTRLIGQSIGDVFYPRITEAANNGENVNNLIKKATLILAGIGIIPFGTVFLIGPMLFEFVFGAGWNVAGEYARWIALASFSVFINRPSVRSMPVLSAQRFHLIFTILRLIVRTLALVIGFVLFKSDIIAIAFFGITSLILNLILISVTLSISKKT